MSDAKKYETTQADLAILDKAQPITPTGDAKKEPVEIMYPADWVGPKPMTLEGMVRMVRIYQDAGGLPAGLDSLSQGMLVMFRCITLGIPFDSGKDWITPIRNRMCVWGDLLPAMAQRTGELTTFKIATSGSGETLEVACTVGRKGIAEPYTARYSWAMAKRAGHSGKDTYQKYPERMLARKAMSEAFRFLFADALCGLAVAEDVLDEIQDQAPTQAIGNVRDAAAELVAEGGTQLRDAAADAVRKCRG